MLFRCSRDKKGLKIPLKILNLLDPLKEFSSISRCNILMYTVEVRYHIEKQNLFCVTYILDISTKPTLLCLPSSVKSNKTEFISLAAVLPKLAYLAMLFILLPRSKQCMPECTYLNVLIPWILYIAERTPKERWLHYGQAKNALNLALGGTCEEHTGVMYCGHFGFLVSSWSLLCTSFSGLCFINLICSFGKVGVVLFWTEFQVGAFFSIIWYWC